MARWMPVLLLPLLSCSFTTLSRDRCVSTSECRNTFGLGYECSDDGYCDLGVDFPRCDEAISAPLDTPVEPVSVGSLLFHETDSISVEAARLAVIQANATGGVAGRPIRLVECDYSSLVNDGRDVETAIGDAARWMIDVGGVTALVGPGSSSGVVTAWDVVSSRNALLVSPSATSPALTDLDGAEHSDSLPGRVWRTVPPDSLQGAVLAYDIEQLEHQRVALIYSDDVYGQGLRDVISANIGRVIVSEMRFSAPALIPDHLLELSELDVDAIVMVSPLFVDSVAFLDAVATLDALKEVQLFVPDAGAASLVLEAAVDSGTWPRLRGTRPSVEESRVYSSFETAYAAEYRGRSPADSSYAPHAFDAMWLALYGAAWAETYGDVASATDWAVGMRHLSAGEPVELRATTWLDAQAALASEGQVDIHGASGALDYDPVTQQTTAPIEVWTVDLLDGEPVVTVQYVVSP